MTLVRDCLKIAAQQIIEIEVLMLDTRRSYAERSTLSTNPCAQKLLRLMQDKQTNLAVAADLTRSEDILRLAQRIGDCICIFKTHIDMVSDFNWELIEALRELAAKHNFIFFEDRKFLDIGNTVLQQYTKGPFRIAEWAEIVNASIMPGPGIIDALRRGGSEHGNGLLLLAQMSSADNLFDERYQKTCVEWARAQRDFVIGFVAQQRLCDDPDLIHMTPGVKFAADQDELGQRYSTPEYVIGECGSDIIIVGRGVTQADDPSSEAEKYRRAGWDAYQS